MKDDLFARALTARLPDRYGDVVHVGPRGAYPLTLQHAVDYTAPRVALVADAAHGMHPIAGQGLNLGLRDVRVLADLMIAAVSSRASDQRSRDPGPSPDKTDEDPGSPPLYPPHYMGGNRGGVRDDAHIDFGTPDILNAYAHARKPDILALMSGTDILTGLFGSRAPFVRPLRKIGMRVIEHLPPVKDFFIRVAKGE